MERTRECFQDYEAKLRCRFYAIINDVYTSFKPLATVPVPCACTSIKKLSRVLGRVYDAALGASPMNVTQLAVLRCIGRRTGEPLIHVAEELEMDRSSL